MREEDRKLLHDSFDRDLTPEEDKRLSSALENSSSLEEEKEDIASLRGLLSAGLRAAFLPGFADGVMDRIHEMDVRPAAAADFFNSLILSFRRVAVAGALACLVLVIISWKNSKPAGSSEEAIAGEDMSVEGLYEQLTYSSLEDVL